MFPTSKITFHNDICLEEPSQFIKQIYWANIGWMYKIQICIHYKIVYTFFTYIDFFIVESTQSNQIKICYFSANKLLNSFICVTESMMHNLKFWCAAMQTSSLYTFYILYIANIKWFGWLVITILNLLFIILQLATNNKNLKFAQIMFLDKELRTVNKRIQWYEKQ